MLNYKIRFFSYISYIISIILFLILVTLSCGSENEIQGVNFVSGYVVNVESLSLKQLKSFELVDKNDHKIFFVVQGDLGKFSPSHMRQHMLLGESIIVKYSIEDGKNIVESVDDLK